MTAPDELTADVARSRQAAVDRRMQERAELAELIRETITPLTRGEPDFYGEAFTATADAILSAGWRPLSPPVRQLYDTAEYDDRPFPERLEEYRQAAIAMIKAQPLISADEILEQIRRESDTVDHGPRSGPGP